MQLKDMKVATKRLKLALEKKEKVFLFGDYDVDGTTAVATLSLGLKNAGWDVITYIPDRYTEGYGLSKKGIDKAIEEGAGLLITLDCGIKALELVNYANEKSLDIIITDHHNPGEILPNALAVINPKRQDCSFPFKELSGCGVGYMLCIATYKSISLDPNKLNSLMDLVAISIGADMVPFNRCQ
jgi:single-stranded-DNA-specific exonuclease